MLDRIEKQHLEKFQDLEEVKMEKGLTPVTRPLTSTKTSWVNFSAICQEIKREPVHLLDFIKAELDVEGNLGNQELGNMILQGKYQNKHITALYRQYVEAYVRCRDCKSKHSELTRDSSTRLQNLECKDCGATRTVQNIQKGYHAKREGERRKEKQKVVN